MLAKSAGNGSRQVSNRPRLYKGMPDCLHVSMMHFSEGGERCTAAYIMAAVPMLFTMRLIRRTRTLHKNLSFQILNLRLRTSSGRGR